MKKKLFWKKLFLSSMVVISIIFAPFFLYTSSAQCTRSNVNFLSLSDTKAMIYWQEYCSDNSFTVYYQRSIDSLKTWSEPKTLISIADGGSAKKAYEEPIIGGNTVITAVAIERIKGQAKIYVKTSQSSGATWSGLKLIKSFLGTFIDCPMLDLQYEPKLGLFILTTVIKDANGIHIFLLSSSDGITWRLTPKLGRANLPENCQDE